MAHVLPFSDRAERARAAVATFYGTSLDQALERHLHEDAFARALALFRDARARVPAYARFLAERGFTGADVRTRADFERLPALTKANYYRRPTLPGLGRDGRLEHSDFVAVSSGSTGEPAIWPRFVSDELATAERFEQVLGDAFRVQER